MQSSEFKLGEVVENPDLAVWGIVDDDLPRDVVLRYVFARALGAPLGHDGAPMEYRVLRNLSEDACARNVHALDAHWRDGAAVVVNVEPTAHKVFVIVRHGPVFRLISRTMQ